MDVSVHPFTGGSHPSDVRMTTRFKLNDISEGLTGAIHETGHSLYEQGRNLNEDYRDLPISEALSMGAHESQSLLWERMVALSLPFQSYLLGKLTESFPDQFKDVTPEELYESLNTIKDRSVIRVESDEVTYCMHIVLRWEIESALIKGEMEVKDVPKVWNAKMKEYLDVDVDILTNRLQNSKTRPLLYKKNLKNVLNNLINKRKKFYKKADLIVKNEENIIETTENILKKIKN